MNPRNEVDDWLTELPPLDGEDDGEPDAKDQVAEDLIGDDGEPDSLDDASAEDLEVDDGLDITEEESISEDDDKWEADVGEAEIDLGGESSAADDGPDVGTQDDDLDVDDEPPSTDDDAGEEGTTDPIEHSIDEELPQLDADDEGDFEDTLLQEVQLAAGSIGAPRWADVLWEEAGGASWPLDVISDNDALVSACASATPTTPVIALVTAHGLVSARRGASTPGQASTAAAPPLQGRAPVLIALTGAIPTVWVASRTGEIAKSDDLCATWTRCASSHRAILALGSREDGSLSVLARDGKIVQVMTTADGSTWLTEIASVDLVIAPGMARVWIAQRGRSVAIGDADGVAIARDGGPFLRVPRSAGATAGVFMGGGSDPPLALAGALVEGDDVLYLGRVRRDDPMEIIAEIDRSGGGDESVDEAAVLSLAWDEVNGSVYVVTPGRVSAWSPRRRPSIS